MKSRYIQYGCGLSAPKEWLNFDTSPTLRLQRIPVLGYLFYRIMKLKWPRNVLYGNIIKGLPGIKRESCQGIYCSHVLEHLSLHEFRTAIKNTRKYLVKSGIFRLVVPDLKEAAEEYLKSSPENPEASLAFMEKTLLGEKYRARGLKGITYFLFSNSKHRWMWDYNSLEHELIQAGFSEVREGKFNDSNDAMFKLVENPGRFVNAVAIEAIK